VTKPLESAFLASDVINRKAGSHHFEKG